MRRRTLLEWDAGTERFRLHDLVRVFAGARQASDPALMQRYIQYYLQLAQQIDALYQQGGRQAAAGLALFDLERMHIDTSWTWLAVPGATLIADSDRLLLDYIQALEYISDIRYATRQDTIPRLEAAINAARRLGDLEREGALRSNLGNAYRNIGDLHHAMTLYEESIALARRCGDRRGEGYTLGNLGRIFYSLGEYARARDLYEQRLSIARDVGDHRAESCMQVRVDFERAIGHREAEQHAAYLKTLQQ